MVNLPLSLLFPAWHRSLNHTSIISVEFGILSIRSSFSLLKMSVSILIQLKLTSFFLSSSSRHVRGFFFFSKGRWGSPPSVSVGYILAYIRKNCKYADYRIIYGKINVHCASCTKNIGLSVNKK